jgi:hypothetical protein
VLRGRTSRIIRAAHRWHVERSAFAEKPNVSKDLSFPRSTHGTSVRSAHCAPLPMHEWPPHASCIHPDPQRPGPRWTLECTRRLSLVSVVPCRHLRPRDAKSQGRKLSTQIAHDLLNH